MDCADVTGDIVHLKSLEKLEKIWLGRTEVTGDISHIVSLPKLNDIDFEYTNVYGDEIAFHEFRKSSGLSVCEVNNSFI